MQIDSGLTNFERQLCHFFPIIMIVRLKEFDSRWKYVQAPMNAVKRMNRRYNMKRVSTCESNCSCQFQRMFTITG